MLRLVEKADGLIGASAGRYRAFRSWAQDCQARNPRLVYGRMTGWGQDGPMAQAAGHDITYTGRRPARYRLQRRATGAAVDLVGDFGGGGMLLAYGMVCGF